MATHQTLARRFIHHLAEAVALSLSGNRHHQRITLIRGWKFHADERPTDPLAGLTVVEVAKAGIAFDALVKEFAERSGALVKIESEENRIFEQIPAKWNRPEGNIKRTC
jgi:hypothetical protein